MAHQQGFVPAIWFRYDLMVNIVKQSIFIVFPLLLLFQPITIKYSERREKLYTFITSICAVVGGSFTVASILDSLIFTASQIFKKFELNKLT